jgi:hypothetical protein
MKIQVLEKDGCLRASTFNRFATGFARVLTSLEETINNLKDFRGKKRKLLTIQITSAVVIQQPYPKTIAWG